jgi:hypothetical protein
VFQNRGLRENGHSSEPGWKFNNKYSYYQNQYLRPWMGFLMMYEIYIYFFIPTIPFFHPPAKKQTGSSRFHHYSGHMAADITPWGWVNAWFRVRIVYSLVIRKFECKRWVAMTATRKLD